MGDYNENEVANNVIAQPQLYRDESGVQREASDATGMPTREVVGVGAMQSVPAGSTNGTPLGTSPTVAVGARFYLGTGDSVTFTIAASQPTTAPGATFTISGASGGTGPNWDENLSNGEMIYITATTGTPKFRWF